MHPPLILQSQLELGLYRICINILKPDCSAGTENLYLSPKSHPLLTSAIALGRNLYRISHQYPEVDCTKIVLDSRLLRKNTLRAAIPFEQTASR